MAQAILKATGVSHVIEASAQGVNGVLKAVKLKKADEDGKVGACICPTTRETSKEFRER